jgi:hypothetical protein
MPYLSSPTLENEVSYFHLVDSSEREIQKIVYLSEKCKVARRKDLSWNSVSALNSNERSRKINSIIHIGQQQELMKQRSQTGASYS